MWRERRHGNRNANADWNRHTAPTERGTTTDRGTTRTPEFAIEPPAESLDDEVIDLRVTRRRRIVRRLWKPAVRERPVPTEGIVGFYYEPPTDGPHPPVLLLDGSSGQALRRREALLGS